MTPKISEIIKNLYYTLCKLYIKTYIKIHERNYVSFISITLLRCYVTKTVFSWQVKSNVENWNLSFHFWNNANQRYHLLQHR